MPIRNARTRGGRSTHINTGVTAPATMATPPIRGIGISWTLRSPGASMNESFSAERINGGISTIVMNIAMMKVKNESTFD